MTSIATGEPIAQQDELAAKMLMTLGLSLRFRKMSRSTHLPLLQLAMDQHFSTRAAFVAVLSPADEERQRADRHAALCPACREALDEGNALIVLLRSTIGDPTRDHGRDLSSG